ncbi:MAG: hypothetical protein KKD48_00110 [Nanoarchaeota archaeon]|nr:hypothetical protein [Nanoarchaeota archaeon]
MESCKGLYSKMESEIFTKESFEKKIKDGIIVPGSLLEFKVKHDESHEENVFLKGYFVSLEKEDITISDYPQKEEMSGLMIFPITSISHYKIK